MEQQSIILRPISLAIDKGDLHLESDTSPTRRTHLPPRPNNRASYTHRSFRTRFAGPCRANYVSQVPNVIFGWISYLPPQRSQPLLLGMRIDVCPNHKRHDIEEGNPRMLGQEFLGKRQCQG